MFLGIGSLETEDGEADEERIGVAVGGGVTVAIMMVVTGETVCGVRSSKKLVDMVRLVQSCQDPLWQMRANETVDSRHFPECLGEPDCSYYIRTGLCRFGMTYRFNHPPNMPIPVVKLEVYTISASSLHQCGSHAFFHSSGMSLYLTQEVLSNAFVDLDGEKEDTDTSFMYAMETDDNSHSATIIKEDVDNFMLEEVEEKGEGSREDNVRISSLQTGVYNCNCGAKKLKSRMAAADFELRQKDQNCTGSGSGSDKKLSRQDRIGLGRMY